MLKKKALVMSVLCAVASVGFVMSASAEETMSGQLDEVVVEAERGVLPGGFVKSEGSVGILGSKDIMDTPFQQTNISQKAIDIFGSNPSEASVNALINVPSIRNAGSTLYNDFSIRGQNANAYQFRVNGIPNMLSQTNVPMNFVESVEVTSGASVGINGVAASESAGGTIMLRTKRAHENKITYKTGFSGQSSWLNEIDVSQRFGKNNENGLYIEASHVDGNTGIKGEESKATTFAINYDRETDKSDTNLFLGYRDSRASEAVRYFYMANLTSLPSAPKGSNNYAFKNSTLGMKTYMATLNHVQKFTDKTRAFINAGTAYNDGYDYIVPMSSRYDLTDSNGNFSRTIAHGPFALRNTYVQAGLQQDWDAGIVKNTTTIAFDKDWYRTEWNAEKGTYGTVTGNLFTGNVSYDFITETAGSSAPSKTQLYGWSAINESTIGKATVTLGLHKHTSKATSASGVTTKSDALSPMYGLVYKPTDKVSLFANHVESFQAGSVVGSGYDNTGDILDPAKTKSNEVGVKFTNGKFYAGLSYFDMEKQNQFEKNKCMTLDGRLNYKGLELSMGGEIAPKWSLSGGILMTDSDYENTNTSGLEGKQILGTSKWSGVGILQYAPDEDTAIFGRAVYTGSAPLYGVNNVEMNMPSSTIYDLGATYKTKINKTPVTFTATVFNLFNKDYWLPRATYCYGILGNPRTVSLTATFEF